MCYIMFNVHIKMSIFEALLFSYKSSPIWLPFQFSRKMYVYWMWSACDAMLCECVILIYFFLIRPLLTLFYNVKSFQLTQNEKFVKGSLAHCKWFAVISFWVLESNVCSNCSFPFKMTIDRLVNMCIGMEYIYICGSIRDLKTFDCIKKIVSMACGRRLHIYFLLIHISCMVL